MKPIYPLGQRVTIGTKDGIPRRFKNVTGVISLWGSGQKYYNRDENRTWYLIDCGIAIGSETFHDGEFELVVPTDNEEALVFLQDLEAL